MGIRISPERSLLILLVLGCVLHTFYGPGLGQAPSPGQSSGCNGNVVASKDDDPAAKEALAMINRPATMTDLLQNIKFALEHDLLLQKDFYSDENLERFFNTSQIKWSKNEPAAKIGTLFPLDDLPYKSTFERSHVDIYMDLLDRNGQPSESGKMKGQMTVTARCPVEVVEKIFGTDMEVTDPYARNSPEHPTPLSTPTHKYGNMRLTYRFAAAAAKEAGAVFMINSDGTVNRLNAYEEEK